MDCVPRAFREQVATLWKCCATQNHHSYCVSDGVPDCEWAMVSKEWIHFYLACGDGEWKYGFRTSRTDEFLTMDQLMKDPNLKHVQIKFIEVDDAFYKEMMPLDVDMECLLKFVVYLSNEPILELNAKDFELFSSPEEITISTEYNYFPGFNSVLENQFLRRKPTKCFVDTVGSIEDITFFVEHVKNGNIRRFYGIRLLFPIEVIESIINAYLENPDSYSKDNFEIVVDFEDQSEAFAVLDKKVEEGLCIKDNYNRYFFNADAGKQTRYECLGFSLSHSWSGAFCFEMCWIYPKQFAASDASDASDISESADESDDSESSSESAASDESESADESDDSDESESADESDDSDESAASDESDDSDESDAS